MIETEDDAVAVVPWPSEVENAVKATASIRFLIRHKEKLYLTEAVNVVEGNRVPQSLGPGDYDLRSYFRMALEDPHRKAEAVLLIPDDAQVFGQQSR